MMMRSPWARFACPLCFQAVRVGWTEFNDGVSVQCLHCECSMVSTEYENDGVHVIRPPEDVTEEGEIAIANAAEGS